MRVGTPAIARSAGWCAAALFVGALAFAPAASAEPDVSPPPPAPLISDPAPAAAPADPASLSAPLPIDGAPQAQGVPHLPSLDNLPPGTTAEPVGGQQGRGMGYLRELWHAMRTQDVSGGDALLLLTQRPLDADATPPPGMAAGPQQPGPQPPAN